MQSTEVKALLEERIQQSQVIVEGEGCNFCLTIISEKFAGMMAVKRQQTVYKHLHNLIANGSIHAVTMTTHTPTEARKKGLNRK